jgi:hypothetical protein
VQTIVDAITNDRGGLVDAIETVSPTFTLVEAADRDALNAAMEDGQLGRTTGTHKIVYADIDGRERPLEVLRAASLAELDALAKAGELGTVTDSYPLYWYRDGVRTRLDALD